MSEESPRSSHLDIIMYSEEEGEITVEGDEEEEQLTNGVYEQYYDDAVFEIDDLPMEFNPPSSPEIQVRYYAPNHQEPHGLSQSVTLDETDYFMRMQSVENQESSSSSSPPSPLLLDNETLSHDNLDAPPESTIYSQSAPVTSFLSNFSIKQYKYKDDQGSVHSDYSTDTVTQVTVLMHSNASTDKHTNVTHHDTSKGQQDKLEEPQDTTVKVDHKVLEVQPDGTETENQDISAEAQQDDTDRVQQEDTDEIRQDDSEKVTEKNTKIDGTEKEQHAISSESQQSSALHSNVVSPTMPSPCNSDENDNQLQMVLASSSSSYHMTSEDAENNTLNDWHNLATTYFRVGRIEFPPSSSSDYQSITQHAVPIKVTGMPIKSRHKDISDHFYDPSTLSVRYIGKLRCAYVTYRNYEEMMKAVFKYNGSVMKGKRLYCRPSLLEELEQDNELNSKIIYYTSRLHPRSERHHEDMFIPERHGIAQYEDSEIFHSYTVPIHQYSPRSIASTKGSDLVIHRTSHSAFRTIPLIKLVTATVDMTPHYVIIKPWLQTDVQASKEHQYWSVSLDKAFQLNYLFRNSLEVNLIFSVKGTKAFQGYAAMKSEVLDLKVLMKQDTVGTIFQDTGFHFRTKTNGRPWRYVCRVEWKSTKKVPFSATKQLVNPWFSNHCINVSKDCTLIEPNVGKQLVYLMSDF
ncbi:YT521-B-like domain-containing protein [Pilaira anomala]|nr:YT521-B-like domain-containing protein [Pilaira anomala]